MAFIADKVTILASRSGDYRARNTLIEANLGLIRSAIPRIECVDIREFLAVAVFAFIAALHHCDPEPPYRASYFYKYIRGAVLRQYQQEMGTQARLFSFGKLSRLQLEAAQTIDHETDEIERLKEFLAKLAPVIQNVLLWRSRGLSCWEIADRLGANQTKVRREYGDGLRQLREWYGLRDAKPTPVRASVVTPKPGGVCSICGASLRWDNAKGVCQRTAACRTKRNPRKLKVLADYDEAGLKRREQARKAANARWHRKMT